MNHSGPARRQCRSKPPAQISFVTGSEVERYGLGLVQEIDSAAMHLWVRWQHQEVDVDLAGFGAGCGNGCQLKQSFEDWDLFQSGGIIFF